MKEFVVLIDENDTELGVMEKQEAHIKGVLHRAFSVFIFNNSGEMLLQQRASQKYHSPLKWTNACCSHPRKNETYPQAAHRRLQEELGFDCELKEKFSFVYKAEVGQGLIEHELDHVFIGNYQEEIHFNKEEVNAVKWMAFSELISDLKNNPKDYTEWFKIIFEHYRDNIENHKIL